MGDIGVTRQNIIGARTRGGSTMAEELHPALRGAARWRPARIERVIRDIVHLNINVTDIDRSIGFYRKLGFEVMHVFGDAPTSDVGDGMHFGGGHMRGAVLTLGDHPRCWTKLELIQWVQPPTEAQPPRTQTQAGVSRVALRCKGLLAFHEKLLADGVEFEAEPQEIDIVGAKRFALFRDPDGTLLELIEF